MKNPALDFARVRHLYFLTGKHAFLLRRSSRRQPGMRDLKDSRWMWIKAVLFLFIGISASVLIVLERPEWRLAVLLLVALWSFCRAYYFAFYVIERYIDPDYRFSGLLSVVRYLLGKKDRAGSDRHRPGVGS